MMQRKRHRKEQIIAILKEHEAGTPDSNRHWIKIRGNVTGNDAEHGITTAPLIEIALIDLRTSI
jgi:hypothetical protein